MTYNNWYPKRARPRARWPSLAATGSVSCALDVGTRVNVPSVEGQQPQLESLERGSATCLALCRVRTKRAVVTGVHLELAHKGATTRVALWLRALACSGRLHTRSAPTLGDQAKLGNVPGEPWGIWGMFSHLSNRGATLPPEVAVAGQAPQPTIIQTQ